MKRKQTVSGVGFLALLLMLFLAYSTQVVAGQEAVTWADNEDYQVAAAANYDEPGGWTSEGDNDAEGEAEETDEGSWNNPDDTDADSSIEMPSDEEDSPPAYEEDDTAMEDDTE